jgi:Uma2 family endonuclease
MAQDTLSCPVHYPLGNGIGETGFQQFVMHALMEPLRDYFASLPRDVLVGGDQFFYYREGDPTALVYPDVYIVDDETTALRDVDIWKVWERGGKAPALALEVVSRRTNKKDHSPELLERYTALGVRELVRYDPDHRGRGGRRLLTHWVRDDHGALVLQPSPPDRVQSAHFGFWLVYQPDDQSLALCTGPNGADRWQTTAERAIAENQRLRAELARLRGE